MADELVQRYYSNQFARFMTPDRYHSSNGPKDPGSWNRYAYVQGDPINANDPSGRFLVWIGEDGGDFVDLGGGGGPGGGGGGCSGGDPFAPGPPDPFCYSGPVLPPPSDPKPPQPSCSITELARGVGGLGTHTYLEINDPNDGIYDILEGAPTKHPKFPNPFGGNWGNLQAWISGTVDANQASPLKGDNPGTDTAVASITGTGTVCNMVDTLLNNSVNYSNPQNKSGNIPPSPYRPIPQQGSGYANSNSFTFTLLFDVGLTASYWQPSGWSPGWGIFVNGL